MKFAIFLFILLAPIQSWAKPLVVSTIRPLTMIIEAIAGDSVDVHQLLSDTQEPHHYSMRIADNLALSRADLVIWIGPELESFLVRAIANLNPEKVITANALPGIQALSQAGANDPHIWLNPQNGIVIATELSNWLAAHYPSTRPSLLAKQQLFRSQTLASCSSISESLAPLADAKILVDHDAFGHFFSFFNIQQAGALKTTSGRPIGAGSLHELLGDGNFDCIITEPRSQVDRVDKIAATLSTHSAQENQSPTVMLDPLGADIADSENAYVDLLNGLAKALQVCIPGNASQTERSAETSAAHR